MQDGIARQVHRIMDLGLALRRELRRGNPLAFEREHARLKELLQTAGPELGPPPAPVTDNRLASRTFLGIRYALACWLDELFTTNSPWADRWNERKLEVELYGSNDRAWKFWEQARFAEQLPEDDALEVFYLCVHLGFRGMMTETPDKLQSWLVSVRDRLREIPLEETAHELEPDPVPDVPPRTAEKALENMLARAGTILLMLIPVLSFLLVYAASGR